MYIFYKSTTEVEGISLRKQTNTIRNYLLEFIFRTIYKKKLGESQMNPDDIQAYLDNPDINLRRVSNDYDLDVEPIDFNVFLHCACPNQDRYWQRKHSNKTLTNKNFQLYQYQHASNRERNISDTTAFFLTNSVDFYLNYNKETYTDSYFSRKDNSLKTKMCTHMNKKTKRKQLLELNSSVLYQKEKYMNLHKKKYLLDCVHKYTSVRVFSITERYLHNDNISNVFI
jgi:hypothetical protein